MFGININGDVPIDYIKYILKYLRAFDYIFVGENINYKHPFVIVPYLLENTRSKVSTGIISPFLNGFDIIERFCITLMKFYRDRFFLSIGVGDFRALADFNLKPSINKIIQFVLELKKKYFIKIFSAASGKVSIRKLSSVSDGILLNFSNEEFLKWAMKHMRKEVIKACYAPSLILPDNDKNYKRLVISAAYVFTGYPKSFLEEFSLKDKYEDIKKVLNDYSKLKLYEKFLIENFTISGNADEVLDKINRYKKIGIDIIVFATPIYKSLKSLKILSELISSINAF